MRCVVLAALALAACKPVKIETPMLKDPDAPRGSAVTAGSECAAAGSGSAAGCAPAGAGSGTPPPPLPGTRDFASLPELPATTDERDLFDMFVAIYIANGFPEAKSIKLLIADHVMIPYTLDDRVFIRHYLGEGPAITEHLDAVSTHLYGKRLAAAAPPAAYRAFMTVLIAHEMAHALANLDKASKFTSDPYAEETRAIIFERAALLAAIDAGKLPKSTLDDYLAFNKLLLAAAPPKWKSGASPAAFNREYPQVVAGLGKDPKQPHVNAASVDLVLAMYTDFRLTHAASPQLALEALKDRL